MLALRGQSQLHPIGALRVMLVSTKPLLALRRANSVAQALRRMLLISLVDLSVLHVLLDGTVVLLAMLRVYRVLPGGALVWT